MTQEVLTQDVMSCPKCNRLTPASRVRCIYCGADLPVSAIQAAPPQRPIESHEQAFNAVLEPDRGRGGQGGYEALASALNMEVGEAVSFISAEKRVPLSRCQTVHEAELIAALVRTCGFKASVIADSELELDAELIRARRIACIDDSLQVFHQGGSLSLPIPEIKLLVVGLLKSNRVDYTEGIAGSREQNAAIRDSFEFLSDEMLLDVYTATLGRSFRLRAGAFDYSGLVQPLSFRAEANFQSAVQALKNAARYAVVDNDFQRVRRLLCRAWPERSRIQARGFKRAGIARRPVAQSSLFSDNRDQFDRYSRLMFLSVAAAPQMTEQVS